MDWTAVFEESGDEDFLIAQELLARPHAPRLARLVSKLYHHPDDRRHSQQSDRSHEKHLEGEEDYGDHRFFSYRSSESLDSTAAVSVGGRVDENSSSNSGYTLQALYYLTINYILGVGVLGQPAAFARAGFLLCGGILSTVTLFSYMTVMWVAETGERYHQQCQEDNAKKQKQQSTLSEGTPLLTTGNSGESHERPDEQQDWDRYEVVDLVGHYLGPGHQILYQASLMALMYIGLLAYSQVFCSAVTELLWGPTAPRVEGLPQLVFGLMVVPLSCVELDEQISVQSIMAAVRFLAIFIMVFGSVLALLLDDSNTTNPEEGPPFWAPPERDSCQMSYTACVSGFGVAFSTSLFSQLFQHSVPGLLRPLRDQPSKHSKVPKTLGASLLTTLCLYLLLGTAAASFFGVSTRSSVNLNFANFTMGLDDPAPFWLLAAVKVASSIVVIFPALDTISVFPLIANTLGNNLCSAAVGPSTIKWCARSLHKAEGLCHSARTTTSNRVGQRPAFGDLTQEERQKLIAKSSRLTTIFWRLVAALPPLFGSLVAADLSFSLLLAGVAGVYVAFFAPSLMQLRSVSTHNNSHASRTIFHGWYSTTGLCYPVLVFATFSLGAVLVQIKEAWAEMQS